jgi:hypothetical protein
MKKKDLLPSGLLDFNEIPAANPPSSDPDAFEKFAKQFLELVHGANIIKTVGRGPDRGADLIAQVDSERWLVSCKHYIKSAVPKSALGDPGADLDEHGCDRFVAFFSNTPSDTLVARLVGIEKHRAGFRHYLWSNRKIEQQLLSHQNVAGWLLAARWFPKSYARLFSRLAYPLEPVSAGDVEVNEVEGTMRVPGLGFKMFYSPEYPGSHQVTLQSVVGNANEELTARAFDRIFVQRVAEFAAVFPKAFVKRRAVEERNLRTRDIFPSWDFSYLASLMTAEPPLMHAVYNICRVWSFWDAQRTTHLLRVARMATELDKSALAGQALSVEDVLAMYATENGEELANSAYSDIASNLLSIGGTSAWLKTSNRGFFAALLCFCPGGLHAELDGTVGEIDLARMFGELPILLDRLNGAISTLGQHDRDYIAHHGAEPIEFLRSLKLVDVNCLLLPKIKTGLRCFSQSAVEPWIPPADPSPEVGVDFGLSPYQALAADA